MQIPVIGITMGDPAGVGPEIIAKFFLAKVNHQAQYMIFGSPDIIELSFKEQNLNIPFHVIDRMDCIKPMPISEGILIYKTAGINSRLPVGRVCSNCGFAAYDAVLKAISAAKSGFLKAIVTAPVNKESLREASVAYIGHTEILAQLTKTPEVFMLMVNDVLRVILCTVHVSLRKAIDLLNEKLVYNAIKAAEISCSQLGVARPRIAVAGLNPHAGENGLMGNEESLIIKPAVERAMRDGINVSGPWPPDTVFMMAREGIFDIVVAQYHDQGLIPFKYLGLEDGVNITVGLPFVRTSPDHGTAFNIAGKGLANPSSFINAATYAAKLSKLILEKDI